MTNEQIGVAYVRFCNQTYEELLSSRESILELLENKNFQGEMRERLHNKLVIVAGQILMHCPIHHQRLKVCGRCGSTWCSECTTHTHEPVQQKRTYLCVRP